MLEASIELASNGWISLHESQFCSIQMTDIKSGGYEGASWSEKERSRPQMSLPLNIILVAGGGFEEDEGRGG
jgi:hypothetical protein